MGVLVIAPAGNVTGSNGPLIPASFESIPAPIECKDGSADHHRTAGGSLVYAASALDVEDQRLITNRPFGQSRMAALGLSLTAPGDSKERPYTYPLNGTSGAGAVVAGVAAAVWTARPELDPHAVMELVYDGGIPLDGGLVSKRARTDFCLKEPLGPCTGVAVHRVFLCGALQRALPNERLTCIQSPVTAKDLPQLPARQRHTDLPPPPKPCAFSGCDVLQGPFANQQPLGLVPQVPSVPSCPLCIFDKAHSWIGGRIYPDATAAALATAVLHTYRLDPNTNQFVEVNSSFRLDVQNLNNGDFTVPVSLGAGTYAAEIHATVTGLVDPGTGLPLVNPLPVMFPPTVP